MHSKFQVSRCSRIIRFSLSDRRQAVPLILLTIISIPGVSLEFLRCRRDTTVMVHVRVLRKERFYHVLPHSYWLLHCTVCSQIHGSVGSVCRPGFVHSHLLHGSWSHNCRKCTEAPQKLSLLPDLSRTKDVYNVPHSTVILISVTNVTRRNVLSRVSMR